MCFSGDVARRSWSGLFASFSLLLVDEPDKINTVPFEGWFNSAIIASILNIMKIPLDAHCMKMTATDTEGDDGSVKA